MADSVSRNLAHNIHLDLILEILSRLPAKSLIRFQAVSKLWFSIIHSKDFAKSFLTYSKTRPRLLFNFPSDNSEEEFVFSAPEHDNNTSSVIARHDMTISGVLFTYSSGPVNGFFCCVRGSSVEVCNPTTKQIVKLPDVPIEKGKTDHMYVKLGYDPVKDEYKVLCVTYAFDTNCNIQVYEHLVCAVNSGEKEEWRKIGTNPRDSYTTILGGICIDGFIYFAFADLKKIAKFDVRTEKIDFIQGPQDDNLRFINCNGKLGGIKYDDDSKKMHLWIMEKEECAWNYVTYDVSYECEILFGDERLCIVGEIHTKEVMLVIYELCKPISILYCDLIRKSLRRVQVLGLADYKFTLIHGTAKYSPFLYCFPAHIENIMFL